MTPGHETDDPGRPPQTRLDQRGWLELCHFRSRGPGRSAHHRGRAVHEHQVLDDTMPQADAQLGTRLTTQQAGQLRALLDLPTAMGTMGPLVMNLAA